jgi:peroxiredoxin
MVKAHDFNWLTNALFFSTLLFFSSCYVGEEQSAVKIGDMAPPFVVEDINGNKVSISDYKGKVLLLDFWATTCPHCIDAIPSLNNLQQLFKDAGFTVLSLSTDGKPEPVEKIHKLYSIKYPVLMADHETVKKYKVNLIPTLYLVGQDGRIVYKQLGMDKQQEEYLKQKIETLLENKPKDV